MPLEPSTVTADTIPAHTEAEWREAVAKVLKGASFETLRTPTRDGLTIEPIYARAGDAMVIPTSRGAAPWTISQRIDHPDTLKANGLLLDDLEGGATGLDLVFAGSPHARGQGLTVDGAEEIGLLLAGVIPDIIATRVEAGDGTLRLANLVLDHAAGVGRSAVDLDLTAVCDPIGLAAARGGSSKPLADTVSGVCAEATALLGRKPGGPVLNADGRIYHNAGASRTETLAAMLSTAVAYWRGLEAAGLGLEEAARAIGFTLAVDQDQFSGVAEIRALRLLWARATAAAGIPPATAHIHAETSFRMMSRLDVNTNLIRTTIAAFAAAVGGADSITVLPFTAANGLPDDFARRLARNTQLVLLHESGLAQVADPAAGSGRVEAETRDLVRAAWGLFQEIEASGGIIANLTSGALQLRIAATADARRLDVREGRQPIVGASIFPLAGDRLDESTEAAPSRAPASTPLNAPIPTLVPHRLSEPFEAAPHPRH